jgi:hypothetical protein
MATGDKASRNGSQDEVPGLRFVAGQEFGNNSNDKPNDDGPKDAHFAARVLTGIDRNPATASGGEGLMQIKGLTTRAAAMRPHVFSIVVPRLARGTQYCRGFTDEHDVSGILGRPVKPDDDIECLVWQLSLPRTRP